MALRMAEHARTLGDAARFRISSTVVQSRNPRVADCRGAHRTRLQRDVKMIARQPFLPQCGTGRTDRQYLGVGCGIIQFPRAIPGLRDHATGATDHRTHGDLAPRGGCARLLQGDIHVAVKFHTSVMPSGLHFGKSPSHSVIAPLPPTDYTARMTQTPHSGDRIAKVLSRAGIASRREAERMIEDGRVSVNGKTITSPALNVTPDDRIVVDGKQVGAPDAPRLWLYHKPAGLVTTERDEKDRPTVFGSLPENMPRVMSVGRLDLNSEGLLLLTNDGEMKRKLELPSTGWLRRYRVRINGSVSEAKLDELRAGITVEGITYQPMVVTFDRQQGANAWLTVSLREGKNREIRRAMGEIGVTVNRLIRVSYGPFQLANLKQGEVEEIRQRVVRDQLGLSGKPTPTRVRKPANGAPRGKKSSR